MADKNILEQMLGHLVNGDQAKAEELFHEYVVSASREIYETLIESEMQDDEEEVEEAAEMDDEEEEVSEATDSDEEDMDENFEFAEAGDEGGDPTDDLDAEFGEPEGEMDGEEGEAERSEEELFQDLDSIVDELQAKFDELKGVEGEEHGGDFGGEEEMKDDFEQLATVREYVEKVPAGHGIEKKGGAEGQLSGTGSQSDKPSVNTKSIVAGKNDMGGTTANILSSKEDAPTFAGAAGGALKGSALSDTKPKDMNTGNINVPGGKAGGAFNKKEPGHGAEKKGGPEGVLSGNGGSAGTTDKASLFRGRR
jgi:hypothetical protein